MRDEWKKTIVIGFIVTVFCSCTVVKPYQRAYLNDAEMQQPGTSTAAQFENYYESIREGSSLAEEGKGADPCGCK